MAETNLKRELLFLGYGMGMLVGALMAFPWGGAPAPGIRLLAASLIQLACATWGKDHCEPGIDDDLTFWTWRLAYLVAWFGLLGAAARCLLGRPSAG